jgi:hypothetical protein
MQDKSTQEERRRFVRDKNGKGGGNFAPNKDAQERRYSFVSDKKRQERRQSFAPGKAVQERRSCFVQDKERHESLSAYGTGWRMMHSVWVANP